MDIIRLKQIIKLQKSSVEHFELYAENGMIRINQFDMFEDILFQFVIPIEHHLLNTCYIVCINQLCKLLKNAKGTVNFRDDSTHFIVSICSENINSITKFPLLYNTHISHPMIEFDHILIDMDLLNNVLKSIVNTSELYKMSINENSIMIENIDSINQSIYEIVCEGKSYEYNMFTNAILQRLLKISTKIGLVKFSTMCVEWNIDNITHRITFN